MVAELDNSVGQVVEALKETELLDNCLIVFASDNGSPMQGAPDENYGSNWPMKGNKYTMFEGGTRVPGNSPEIFLNWIPKEFSLVQEDLS